MLVFPSPLPPLALPSSAKRTCIDGEISRPRGLRGWRVPDNPLQRESQRGMHNGVLNAISLSCLAAFSLLLGQQRKISYLVLDVPRRHRVYISQLLIYDGATRGSGAIYFSREGRSWVGQGGDSLRQRRRVWCTVVYG